jgi:hypothetical protein
MRLKEPQKPIVLSENVNREKLLGVPMKYLQKQFPLSFEAIEKLMVEHGAKTHRDDQEWREHTVEDHVEHADNHLGAYEAPHLSGGTLDKDSGQSHLIHYACRALMASEVYLGGGVKPLDTDDPVANEAV